MIHPGRCCCAAAVVLVGTLLRAQPPVPPAGEYVCTQAEMAPSPVSSPGLPPATAWVTSASAFGNLVIDASGGYRFTSNPRERSRWAFDRARGAVTFTGLLSTFSNTYGVRGRLAFFEFSSRAIAMSCSMATRVDYGAGQVVRTTAEGRAPSAPTRSPLSGTLFYASGDGLVKLALADGAPRLVSRNFQFDVRGDEIVLIDAQGRLVVTNEDGIGSRVVPVYGTSNQAPRFSPDGQRLALLGNQPPASVASAMVGAYSSATLEPLVVGRDGRVLAAFGSSYTQPTWTPDGRIVLAGSAAAGSMAGDAATGIFLADPRSRNVQRIDPGFDAPHTPAVSPDGRSLAFINGARIWVMPMVGGGAPSKVYEGAGERLSSLVWAPDGGALMFIEHNAVKVVPRDGGRVLPVQDRDGNPVRSTGTLVWR